MRQQGRVKGAREGKVVLDVTSRRPRSKPHWNMTFFMKKYFGRLGKTQIVTFTNIRISRTGEEERETSRRALPEEPVEEVSPR